MKHENENVALSSGGEMKTPKGVFSPPSREYANSQSRTEAAKATLSALKKRVRFTPEVETPKDELRRCKDGNIRGTLNGLKLKCFNPSQRPGAILELNMISCDLNHLIRRIRKLYRQK